MNTRHLSIFFLCIALLSLSISSCDEEVTPSDPTTYTITPGSTAQEDAQTAMIEMTDGDTIYFNGALFEFTNTLSLDGKDNVVIKGNGRTQTILSFAGQTSGAEGLKINNADDIIMERLTVQNAAGDAIKVKDCDGVVFRYLGAVWTGEPTDSNGAYGLYPVSCNNVLIDSCYVRGASDAGIYVGQTNGAIVKNSIAEKNVAGIEIENTTNADVFGNHSFDNTGGILVFDLPGLSQYGSKSRVFNNLIENNNRRNFAPAGNIVSNVPTGTGVMVLSTKEVEIFDNTFNENNVMACGIINYQVLEQLGGEQNNDPNYDPYPKLIDVRNNTFTRSATLPTDMNTIAQLLASQFAADSIPDIMVDGLYDPAIADTSKGICIRNNTTSLIPYVNLDADGLFQNKSFDASRHDCTNGNLPEVIIDVPE